MNQNILITGTNGGIGLAVVENLLKNNIKNIICHYRSQSDKIKSLLEEYRLNPRDYLFQANLTEESDLEKLKNQISAIRGQVSSVVNIAGMSTNAMSWKLSKEQFSEVIDNNLMTTFLCTKQFIPEMRIQSWGRIINFSSVVGSSGTIGASHYCAAKAGIEGFSKALSLELASKNITVNTIALGYFEYGLIHSVPEDMQKNIMAKIPLNRFGTGKEVGSLVKYLLSEESSYMTGQVLHLSGGLI